MARRFVPGGRRVRVRKQSNKEVLQPISAVAPLSVLRFRRVSAQNKSLLSGCTPLPERRKMKRKGHSRSPLPLTLPRDTESSEFHGVTWRCARF